MWPIVVRDEQRMYFLTNSHIEPFSFESSVELKFNKKRELCVRNEKKKKENISFRPSDEQHSGEHENNTRRIKEALYKENNIT